MTQPKVLPPIVEEQQTQFGQTLEAVLWPLLSFTILLLSWQYGVPLLKIPEYILPIPSAFFERLWLDRMLIAEHTLVTMQEIVLGFLMAAVISVPLGYIIVSIRIL
jgi:NitT/TauT family transport system permease protein